MIEELESSNEELQSLNEEVQSSTEEVQSSNEELQASNEELTTLNDELRLKSLEAAQLGTTLGNIQNSIRTALVVVDREGKINRFNGLAVRIFGIMDGDIGQHLYGVPCHLDLPRLREQVSGVIAQGGSLVERVHQGGFHYLMRIDPYRNELEMVAGAVLTFSDISDLHRAEAARYSSELRFRQVWEASTEGMLLADAEDRLVLVNPALERMFGYAPGELIGASLDALIPDDARDGAPPDPRSRRALGAESSQARRQDGTRFDIDVMLTGMDMEGANFTLASIKDITERRRAERELRESEQRMRLAQEAAQAGTWEWWMDSNRNYWSDQLWDLYGLTPGQGEPSYEAWRATIHPDDRERVEATVKSAAERRASSRPNGG